MEEELEKFLMEQKERVAKDKASLLLQEPPYMEIRRRGVKFDELKENITLPSQKTTNNKEGCVRLSLPLGEEYERKKHQLQQELRQDYRRYMKQCAEDSGVSSGLKLPPKGESTGRQSVRQTHLFYLQTGTSHTCSTHDGTSEEHFLEES
ncbi:centrosome and spindle pole-associated protein 1-like [Alosa pseudoharengus]|uniref:centrosome and spindle pole-associated protein 1-like n=1 Tax=Alosa pseudoharengus TaxID=34774 RepID=UPI003F8BDADC